MKFRAVNGDGSEGEERTVEQITATFRCPCGGTYFVTEEGDGTKAIMHSMPICLAYRDMECDEYLKACRLNGAVPVE